MPSTPTPSDLGALDFPADRTSLRLKEVAKKLSVSERLVNEWIEAGQIQSLNISGSGEHARRISRRISIDEYRRFVRARLGR
jgi:predicted site-specific integrase-resolvase